MPRGWRSWITSPWKPLVLCVRPDGRASSSAKQSVRDATFFTFSELLLFLRWIWIDADQDRRHYTDRKILIYFPSLFWKEGNEVKWLWWKKLRYKINLFINNKLLLLVTYLHCLPSFLLSFLGSPGSGAGRLHLFIITNWSGSLVTAYVPHLSQGAWKQYRSEKSSTLVFWTDHDQEPHGTLFDQSSQ